MKRATFLILSICIMMDFVLNSCNRKDENSLSPTEIQKREILSKLIVNSDLSAFLVHFENLDLSNAKTDEFTVFAVTNSGMTQSPSGRNSRMMQSASGFDVKRHIVPGKHIKSSLSNGQKLLALDGTSLTVFIIGDRFYINGVEMGEEIQAGNSIAYVVEKAAPESISVADYSFTVYECNAAWLPSNPVPYQLAIGATVSLYDNLGRELGKHVTDNTGELTFTFVEGDYYYKVTKGNASNISENGFHIIGIYTSEEEFHNSALQPQSFPGSLKFNDINGDGIINAIDKVNGYISLEYDQDVYIASANFIPANKP